MFNDMLKFYSGHAAIFSNLSCKSAIFTSFTISLTMCNFQFSWFLKRAVAEALKLQKMTVTFKHITYLILVSGETYFVFENHENI